MPGYKGHLLGGAVAFGVTLGLLYISKMAVLENVYIIISCFASTLMGSLFPDIDVKSKGQHYFYWLILFALGYLFYLKQYITLAYCAIAAILPMLVRHRGVFHNLWFIIGLLSLLWYILSGYLPQYKQIVLIHIIFFAVGAASHLWLDLGFVRMFRFR